MHQGLKTPSPTSSNGESRHFVLLLVEDVDADAYLVRELLDQIDPVAYEVVHLRTLEEALAELAAKNRPIDVVLLDLRLADTDGVESVKAVRTAAEAVPIVVLTGTDDDALALACLNAGAQDYLLKSDIRALTLRRSIHYAISRLREQRLREFLNRRINHIVASSPAVLYSRLVKGDQLHHEWISPNVERLTGSTPAEVGEDGWWKDHVHPEDLAEALRQQDRLFEQGEVRREFRIRRRDGSWLWISDEQRLLRDAEGTPFQVVGSWSDVSERHAAEVALAESEERYRLLFEDNPHPMWVFDPDALEFLVVNEAALRILGYSREEMVGKRIGTVYPLDGGTQAIRAFAQDPPTSISMPWMHQCRRKDGTLVELETATHPIVHRGRQARLVVATDVSERRKLEIQLLQAQKMEAVGQLAGGVAHDFNNLLGVITGSCEMLGKELAGNPRAQHRLEEITRAAERATALTRQLLAFGRKQMLQPKVFALDAVVEETAKLLRRLIGEHIEISSRSTTTANVFADPGQIEQIVVNLALNARDAMPAGGQLVLEVQEATLTAADCADRPEVSPGHYVVLSVSDNGTGMAPAIQAQIFEPFFTTKESGKGTGLGLSMVYGIVQQSGGHIAVESQVGRGTVFRIYLPLATGEAEPEPVAPVKAAKGGTETILLFEDSDSLRLILREMLEEAGYQVLDGATLEEAMAFSITHPGPIHLVLSDVVMPGASGPEIVAFLRTQRPEIRAVFMSGYTDEAIGRHGVLDRGIHFLQKPFTSKALRNKLRAVLDSP